MGPLAWVFVNIASFHLGVIGVLSAIYFFLPSVLDLTGKGVGFLYLFSVPEMLVVLFTFEFYRGVRYRSIGRLAIAIIEVITICTSLLLRHLLPFSCCCLIALVAFTINLHSVGQIVRATVDITRRDMLLGALMQILVYLTGTSFYVCSVVLIFCGGAIYYRYLSYEAPITPDDVKKDDLGQLAC